MTLLKQQLGTSFGDVHFGVHRSTRYHITRQRHFETVSRVVSFLIIVISALWGAVILEWGEQGLIWYKFGGPVAVILLSALDMIYSPSAMAATHKMLAQQFNQLDMKMIASEKTDEMASSFQRQRQEIEASEPPSFPVVSIMSQNELCHAIGCTDDIYHVGGFHRIFCHWIKSVSKPWILKSEYESNKRGIQKTEVFTSA
ncbi:MAG: hypothetical protein OXF84_11855 [Bacteroidetes bacterium]|nr:hypothetical protein [Bacteroidota bacterium]